ncbi:ANKRD50, partial [Symbiodinium sp. CCMP2456]
GLWGRFKYMCCREGGAPVVTLSHGQVRQAIHGSEGTYCPEKAGASGRMDYLQKAFGRWQTTSPAKLTFSEETGKWCIGGGCSAETDALDPSGLKLGGFEVTMADDFDGDFK